MTLTIHAGHNPDGKPGAGAVGVVKESTECRRLCRAVGRRLRKAGIKYKGITVKYGKNQSDVLARLKKKQSAYCGSRKCLNISLHMNCYNGTASGTEILYNPSKSKKPDTKKFFKSMEAMGFKNRGLKERTDLYILRQFTGNTYLFEICFCDSKTDVKLYKKHFDEIADAVYQFIVDNM